MAKINLIKPYGNKLVNLLVPTPLRKEYLNKAKLLPSIQISQRSVYDLEILAMGGFSPLVQFMGKADYLSVLENMRLKNGMVFPIPITLPVNTDNNLHLDQKIALRGPHNEILATMTIREIYRWDFKKEASLVYGSTDTYHPLIAEMSSWGKYYLAGPLSVINPPIHYDFPGLYLSPALTRKKLFSLGSSNVVAFQTRNPMHRAHEELTKLAAQKIKATLLIHPSVGMTKPGDVNYFTRVRSYQELYKSYYDKKSTLLGLLPLAMRLAGPREAIWHAIIRQNYGASHFIIGRDHASPGVNSKGRPFYDPYAAKALGEKLEEELDIKLVYFNEMVYVPAKKRFFEITHIPKNQKRLILSGTQVREKFLAEGKNLPDWFTRPEVAKILASAYPAKDKKGFCVWFTGLPSSGKSTTAEILASQIRVLGRTVSVLDGDVVRTHLSKGLGFSKEDRDTNILRIGFVASEIVKHQGIVVCAAVSPYRATRNQVRQMFPQASFFEIYVKTPLSVCKTRDVKGLFQLAKAGKIKKFTGVNDPYEAPVSPDLAFSTARLSPIACSQKIIKLLIKNGFLPKI